MIAVMHAREQDFEELLVARPAVSGRCGKDAPSIVNTAIERSSER
jgi:hypothetical protein